MDIIQLWLVASVSFTFGWVLRSVLLGRRGQAQSFPLHTKAGSEEDDRLARRNQESSSELKHSTFSRRNIGSN